MIHIKQPEGWKAVKDYGYPPDGKWLVKLAPNGRVHEAHVVAHMIQLPKQRRPIDITLILSEWDEWQ